MLLLTSTSDKVQVTTGSAGTIDVHASYVDYNGSSITPGRNDPAQIVTATTTDVVAAPASSVQRNVKLLVIRNSDASVSNAITVKHTDGTRTPVLFGATLAPSEVILFMEGGTFQYIGADGRPKVTNQSMSVVYDSGTSTSGTATTKVCEIIATSGFKFIGWSLYASQTNTASTQTLVKITYSDATTVTNTSGAATAGQQFANAGGIILTAAGAETGITTGTANKDVTQLRVETAGAGTGTRAGIVAAIQVPI